MGRIAANLEKDLSERLRRGDSSAIKEIWTLFSPRLTAICSRYVDDDSLKDVLQETFIKVLTKHDQFRNQGTGSLFAWISRIAVNEALQSLRHDKKLGFVSLDGDYPDEEPDIGDLSPEVLTTMIRLMPPGYRTVFNLYVFEGLSHKEIASKLGIKESSSASQFHRAKAMLAGMINDYRTSRR